MAVVSVDRSSALQCHGDACRSGAVSTMYNRHDIDHITVRLIFPLVTAVSASLAVVTAASASLAVATFASNITWNAGSYLKNIDC